MIEQIGRQLVLQPPQPALLVNERVSMECGCRVLIGIRLDDMEPTAAMWPCCGDHVDRMNHFNLLLRESTVEPEDVPLSEVCERLMEQTWGYYD